MDFGMLKLEPADDPEYSDLMMDQLCLSPEKLKILSGSDNLQEVTSLEICVDTRQETVDNFGIHLPKLAQLKMNNSFISSLRDLGTSLSHLKVLWLARCSLTDLEGILALSSLKELFVAYNSISDLSPVSMLENLELLDLEGNSVDDLAQLWYLRHCRKLRTLSLEGNPVCTYPGPGASEILQNCLGLSAEQVSDYNYRSAVRKLVPQLNFLDDIPVEEEKPQCFKSSPLNWTLLKESFKDKSAHESQDNTDKEERAISVGDIRPVSAHPPDQKISSRSLSSHPGSARPLTSCIGSRPESTSLDLAILNHKDSDLTKGVGSVLCGNPLQAVRAQRQKIKLQNSCSRNQHSTRISSFIPEQPHDYEQSRSQGRSYVFAELRRWRTEHNKHLLAIEKNREPQVMRIHHSDDESSHNESFSSDDIIRDRTVCRDTSSSDSSPLPESPVMSRLASPSACSMSPSPPPNAALSPAGRRITQIRTRRLRPHNADSVSIMRQSEKTPGTDLINLCSQSKMTETSQICLQSPIHSPDSLLKIHRSKAPGNQQHSDIQHKLIICSNKSEKLTPRRPQTPRAALQRLPDQNLLTAQGSTHLE